MMRLDLKRFNKGSMKEFAMRMPRQANFIVSKIAVQLAEFIRNQYLSGQVLRERSSAERAKDSWFRRKGHELRTRSTKESTRFFKMAMGKRRGTPEQYSASFGVRPGSRIKGRLNYLIRFERGAGPGPFMHPAWEAFKSTKTHIKMAQGYMDRFIRAENRRSSGQATDV
jgi:hypothetical protein